MFREMDHTDRNFRAMDLAEKMRERRRHVLSATSKPFNWGRPWRMLFKAAMGTGSPQVQGRA